MEPLPDPLGDRQVKSFEPPPAQPLKTELLFPKGLDGDPDWRCLQAHFFREGRVVKEHCLHIIRRVAALTSCEPNLLRLQDPITVVGDIHGQFYDLVKLLEVGGNADKTQYLFLGDYVDRGSFAVEVVLTLFCLKLCYPRRIWLIRGNHECRQMTAFFNFRDECEYKYDLTVYNAFMDCFDTLSISALVNNRFFSVHGGLSPQLPKKDGVGSINRFQEPPRSGPFCDILWADPVDEDKEAQASHTEAFFPNDVRGCSYFFGFTAAKAFLDENKLLSVIRAHEAQLEGYKMHRPHPINHFPTVITIFSAPNYCDVYNNKGAVLKFDNNTLNIQQFNFSLHPYHLPNFMDIFMWSIPFVSEKISEIMYAILRPTVSAEVEMEEDTTDDLSALPPGISKLISQDDSIPSPPTIEPLISDHRAASMKFKVLTIGRMARILTVLRDKKLLVDELKGISPNRQLPYGALIRGESGLRRELQRSQGTSKMIDF